MQTLMEQLVKMVGHNNAVTEELSQRMDSLETKVDKLEVRFLNQENKLLNLENKIIALENRVTDLGNRMEKGFNDVIQMITVLGKRCDRMENTQALHSEMLRKLAADTAQHEAEILR
ncbi:hypothetical protein SPACI_042130 [Sporomusa acidovorans DSM 3132]|uniref:Chromosome partition protein Smc n=2 Tax=Sporomusa TaxID=2375 RepID=A0ABZ3J6V1_SPOA4|nr:hypothetical protein SPACI_29810 [Sporomusa acidovorans DSM 3132]SDD78339.1 hypothetical protein SAMN04488499_100435 [Sporomusa acidovorans]